ncbi:MAG: phospholipid carrier-dependent glycosyltransferase [Clostridiales bacterium]|nr:phospholipid carrier-dependent glycosyltransferase [Clostridiales bacterium]
MINLLALTASASPGESAPLTLQGAWDAVVYGVSWFFGNLSPAFAWFILGIAVCVSFFVYYWWCLRPRPRSLEWIAMSEERSKPRRMTLTLPCHPMERRDILPVLLLTAVYAFTAFFRLGSLSAPQSVQPFMERETITWELDQEVTLAGIGWYTRIGTGAYSLEVSADGEEWTALQVVDEVFVDGAWTAKRPGQDTTDLQTRTAYYWTQVSPGAPAGSVQSIRQAYNTLLKWHHITIQDGAVVQAKYFRLTAIPDAHHLPMELGEMVLYNDSDNRLDVSPTGADALFDEQDIIPAHPTYFNSSYFDEIYHPRTALEHLNNVYPYEVSHPPLGKLIISVGIMMFGMVPFGWRFMGTLFGVLMVPLLYIFLKNLFGKTPVALCGTALFTFDFMHLVQTRIATIDTYGVFFILVSYYFMYRWLAVPAGKKLRHYILPLGLSGLFWGIGCASKWTVVYAGAGLALLWLLGMMFKAGDWHEAENEARRTAAPPELRQEVTEAMFQEAPPPWERPQVPSFAVHVVGTILLSVLFFVIIPLCIYTASYFPYAIARGNEGGFLALAGEALSWPFAQLPQHLDKLPKYMEQLAKTMAEEGKTPGLLDRVDSFFKIIPGDSSNPVDIMLKNQHFMLTYHQGVHTPHPYESYWYQWIFDGRPILYYRDLDVPGMKSLFASFNNPLVSWAGLAAIFGVAIQTVRRKCGKGLFILIALLSQFVPWLPIGRILFAYHYFPTVLFLCFAIAYLMDDMMTRKRTGYRLAVYGFTGCAAGLYAVFYPELIGLYVPTWYATYFLRWFPSWPL